MSLSHALVHVRTPTYRRPEPLHRCLTSLIEQSHGNWVCDVYDDDPEGSARDVVKAFSDDRITYNHNRPQRFASRNIDKCFSRDNPREADYFCVVEDDNFILPRFMEENIALCHRENVQIILRNQLVEHHSDTPDARLSKSGLLDDKLSAGRYEPDVFRLSLIADIGVSNGGLFWSREASSELEVSVPCSATLQEYMRTFAITEPIYVALEPLAVWAENGDATQRDHGLNVGYFNRELTLKHSIGILQRRAWTIARAEDRANFLIHPQFCYSRESRARGLVKSHIRLGAGTALRWKEALRLAVRGGLIRLIGRPEPGLHQFLQAQAN